MAAGSATAQCACIEGFEKKSSGGVCTLFSDGHRHTRDGAQPISWLPQPDLTAKLLMTGCWEVLLFALANQMVDKYSVGTSDMESHAVNDMQRAMMCQGGLVSVAWMSFEHG